MQAKVNYVLSFYFSSLFFCLFFFLIPLCYVYLNGANYLGSFYEISEREFSYTLGSFCIFILGFLFFDFINLLLPLRNVNTSDYWNYWGGKIPSSVTFLWGVVLAWILFDTISSSAEEIYQVRRGESSGSLIDFFILQVFNACKFTLITLLLAFGKKNHLKLLLIVIIISLLIKSSGRLSLLINFLLLIGLIGNIKSYKLSFLLTPILLISLPLVLYLKLVIYDIAVNREFDLGAILDFSFDWGLYLTNFGHPLFSFLSVENTLNIIGYRYFYDYVQGFIFYLKLFGLDFGDSITYYNTESLLGVRESIVPPSYIAFGYIQMSLLGVFVSGFSYRLIGQLGWVLYRVFFSKHTNNVAIFYISFICANSFYHGDIRILVMTVFFPFLFLFFFGRAIKKGCL